MPIVTSGKYEKQQLIMKTFLSVMIFFLDVCIKDQNWEQKTQVETK